MMNVGLCMPQPGFLQGLRDICHQKWRAADLRRSQDRRQARMGRRFRILQRQARHDLPGQIDRRRLSAGGVRRAQVSDGPDLAAQGFSRRHLQHQSGFHGCGPGHISRGAHPRELRYTWTSSARNWPKATQDRLPRSGLQGYIAVAGANGALMLYPKEIRNYRDWDSDRYRPVAALLVRHGQPRRDGAALLVGRAVDHLRAAHRGRYRQAPRGV